MKGLASFKGAKLFSRLNCLSVSLKFWCNSNSFRRHLAWVIKEEKGREGVDAKNERRGGMYIHYIDVSQQQMDLNDIVNQMIFFLDLSQCAVDGTALARQ